jgi:cytoskeletal protein RodZ
MSDHNGEQGEDGGAGSKPDAAPDVLSGRTRAAPMIEGRAVEVLTPAEAAPKEPEETQETPVSTEQTTTAASEAEDYSDKAEPPRKSSAPRAVAALAGVAVLGAAGYFGWTEYAPQDAPARIAALFNPAGAKRSVQAASENSAPAETQSVPSSEPMKKAEAKANDQTEAEKSAPATTGAPASQPTEKAEAHSGNEATPEKSASPVAPAAPPPANAAPSGEAMKQVEPPAQPENPAPAKSAPIGTAGDTALAEMAAQLATTQAALERVSQRLKAVEGQLAAPKTDTRAALAARDAGPADSADASAHLVVAQALLAAVRQGDDYARMLAALQNLGGDSDRLARLRAGLAAPSPNRLATDFAALAPKILAGATPQASQQQVAKGSQNIGETVLAYLESRAKKLVRVRPAGAPDGDATAARIEQVEKNLARGDIGAALAERAQLPATALALSADWAKSAQARLDAEEAAKAELASALQNLSKSKS